MLKTSLMAAFMVVLAIGPAYAAQDLCNDAHMKQMDGMIAKMTDAAKKKEATTALDMSKAAMKKGDTAGCMKHMEEVHTATSGHLSSWGKVVEMRPLRQDPISRSDIKSSSGGLDLQRPRDALARFRSGMPSEPSVLAMIPWPPGWITRASAS